MLMKKSQIQRKSLHQNVALSFMCFSTLFDMVEFKKFGNLNIL